MPVEEEEVGVFLPNFGNSRYLLLKGIQGVQRVTRVLRGFISFSLEY